MRRVVVLISHIAAANSSGEMRPCSTLGYSSSNSAGPEHERFLRKRSKKSARQVGHASRMCALRPADANVAIALLASMEAKRHNWTPASGHT